MSKIIKAFGEFLLQESNYKKLFSKQSPGNRIVPPQTGVNDSKYELRLDAGEAHGGKKRVYLQVNTQAKNDALKKFRGKHGSHANLAVGTIDENTPAKDQKEAAEQLWAQMERAAKDNLK